MPPPRGAVIPRATRSNTTPPPPRMSFYCNEKLKIQFCAWGGKNSCLAPDTFTLSWDTATFPGSSRLGVGGQTLTAEVDQNRLSMATRHGHVCQHGIPPLHPDASEHGHQGLTGGKVRDKHREKWRLRITPRTKSPGQELQV